MVGRMEETGNSRGSSRINSTNALQNLEERPDDDGVGTKTCLANPFVKKPKKTRPRTQHAAASSSSDHERLMNRNRQQHQDMSQLVSSAMEGPSRNPQNSVSALLTAPQPSDRSNIAQHESVRRRRRGLYDGEVEPEGIRGQEANVSTVPRHPELPKSRSKLKITPSASKQQQHHDDLSIVQETSREESHDGSQTNQQQQPPTNPKSLQQLHSDGDSTCSDDDILHMLPDFVANNRNNHHNLLHSPSAIEDNTPIIRKVASKSTSTTVSSRGGISDHRSTAGPVALSFDQSEVEDMQAAAMEYVKNGQYDRALENFTNVLQIRLTTVGKQHPLTASAYHNLGTVHAKRAAVSLQDSLQQRHCRQAALDCFQAAARIARDSLGPNHPNVAVSLVRVGFVLLQSRHYENAMVTFREALRIRVEHYGRQHGLVANLLNNLGVCSMHLGEFEKGRQYLEEALKIQRLMVDSKRRIASSPKQRQPEGDLASQLLELADTLFNVGGLCLEWIRRQGPDARRALEAETAFTEALQIRREVLGRDDPMVLQVKGLLDMARAAPRPRVHSHRAHNSPARTGRRTTHDRSRSPLRNREYGDQHAASHGDHIASRTVTPEEQHLRSIGASSSYDDNMGLPSTKRSAKWMSPAISGIGGSLSPIHPAITPNSTFSTQEKNSIFRKHQQGSTSARRHAPPLQISVSKEEPGDDNDGQTTGTRIYVAPHLIADAIRSEHTRKNVNDSDVALANASYERDVTFVSDASGGEEKTSSRVVPNIPVTFDAEESCLIGDTGVDSEVGTVHYPLSWNRAGIPAGEGQSGLGRSIMVARPVRSRQNTAHPVDQSKPGPGLATTSEDWSSNSTGNKARDEIMARARAILQAHSSEGGSSPAITEDLPKRSSPQTMLDHDPVEEGVAPLGESWSSKNDHKGDRLTVQEMLRDPMNYLREIHDEASRHLQRGDVVDAQRLFEVVLDCQRHRHGPLHPDVASALHNVGIVMLRAQNHTEALKAFEEAARVRKGALGNDHPLVAVSLVKCGITLLLLHRFDEALWSFREALSVRKHSLGALHPSTARIYNNIGCVYVEFNEFREARRAFEAALDSQRSALCNDPESVSLKFATATTLCNLGYLYRYRDMHGKAAEVLKEAVALQDDVLGEAHPTVLSTLDSLADSCASSGNGTEALKNYSGVLERFRRGHEKGSKKVQRAEAVLLYKMSRVHRQRQDRESQLQCLKFALRAIRQYTNSFGGRNTDTLERRILYDIRACREQMEKEGLDAI